MGVESSKLSSDGLAVGTLIVLCWSDGHYCNATFSDYTGFYKPFYFWSGLQKPVPCSKPLSPKSPQIQCAQVHQHNLDIILVLKIQLGGIILIKTVSG